MEILLDNSAFSILNCQRKFQLRVIEGKTEESSDATSFGSAVHVALELLDKGFTPDTMLERLVKQCPGANVPKVLSLVTFYKASQTLPPPITIDSKPALELKFKHKYCSIIIPGTQHLLDIYLTGTIDRIHIDNDILVIQDYKTTAHAKASGIDQTLESYALAFQLPFYFYALKNFGILPASYRDYIDSRHYRMEIHLLCHNTAPPTFKKHIRHAFNDDFITREVPLIINSKIQEAIAIAGLTNAAPRTGMTVYKACDNCGFRPACLVAGTAKEEEILSRYTVTPYDPLSWR